MKIFLFTLFAFFAALSASAQEINIWTGNVDSNWDNPGNWSLGKTPTGCQEISIPVLSSKPYPSLTHDIYLQQLTLSGGSLLQTNGFNVIMGAAPFSVKINGTAVPCSLTVSVPLTAAITNPGTGQYSYTWTLPDGTTDNSALTNFADTLIVNTSKTGIQKDTASIVVFFKPGFSVNPGADYTATIGIARTNKNTLTASQPGIYTVLVTDTLTGCTASDTAVIKRAGAPSLSIAGVDTLSCTKTSLKLQAYGTPENMTYSWSGPGITAPYTSYLVNVTHPGNYTAVVTNPANNCSSTQTVTIVPELTAPAGTLAGGMLTCNPQSPLILQPSGVSPDNATFTWTGGNIDPLAPVTTSSLSITQIGDYQLKIKNPVSGCELILSATVTANPNCTVAQGCSETSAGQAWNQITYERWNDITGSTVASLTGSPKYLLAADYASILTSFEAPANIADNYGARISGFVVPPTGGVYTFWVAGDESAELWLSTSESPANKVRIAYNTASVASRAYSANPTQKSASITLQCGKRYYIEAISKESTGNDHLSVSWQIPGQLWDQLPIAGQYLAPATTCAFTLLAGPYPGSAADNKSIYLGESLRIAAERPSGWTDTFSWSASQKHFITSATATDSTNLRANADSVYAMPQSAGEYVYKITSDTKATCFKEFKLKVLDVACECTDCDKPQWQSVPVLANADVDISGYTYAAVVENTYLAATSTVTGTTEISQTISYLDGFGRTRQTVQAGVSPTGKDAVLPMQYDGLGRATKSFLPYTAGTNGAFKADALTAQSAFYASLKGDSHAFAESIFEKSPLQRLEQQGSVGLSWQPMAGNTNNTGSDKVTRRHNVAGDNITRISWNYAESKWSIDKYAANLLFVETYKDASNNKTEVFTDIFGRPVCKKVYNGSEVLATYTAYDDFDRSRVLFPPNASVALEALANGNYDFTTITTLKDQIFWYEYDERGRVVIQKTPDAEPEETVYNPHDQVVLYRNGMHRDAGQWLYSKYDEVGRPHSKGILSSSADRGTHQSAVNSAFASAIGYNESAYPTSGTQELTRNYYDDYSFTSNNTPIQPAEFSISHISTGDITAKGKLTGTKENILKASTAAVTSASEVVSILFYDRYERMVQTRSGNHLGTEDISSIKLDFAGRILETKTTSTAYTETTQVWTKNTYDPGNRLKMTCQRINDGKVQPVGRYVYNELGELTEKWQGCKMQVVNYQTDIRGRRTSINGTASPAQLKKKGRFFGQVLSYDILDNVSTQQWGNVPGLNKETAVPEVIRGYGYTYDPLTRLKAAAYTGAASESYALSNLDYDRNGNIKTMKREASTPSLGSSPNEDNLTYYYAPNTNRLRNITDAGAAVSTGKKAHYFNDRNVKADDGNAATDDYAYDKAGNLVRDLNRNISLITYNVIGLPEQISFSNNTKIFYVYTASGAKLQKQGAFLPDVTPGTAHQSKIDYTATAVYTDQTLTFVPTPEGRALPPNTALGGTKFRYEYQLTDHLGNLRTACRCGEKLDANGNVIALLSEDDIRNLVQENHYDPWGLNLPDIEKAATVPDWWQFSMKERDFMAYSEFEFRHYDASIGRFMSIDPLFQQFQAMSPFNYADNNPSTYMDLYGLQAVTVGPGLVTPHRSGSSGGGNKLPTASFSEVLGAVNLNTLLQVGNLALAGANAQMKPFDPKSINTNLQNFDGRYAELREYKPSTADRWREGYFWQQITYNMVDAPYSLFYDHHYGGRGFENYDDKVKTRLGGILSFLPLLSLESQAAKFGGLGIAEGLAGNAAKTSTSLVTKYPANAAIANTTERTFLMPGEVIDRYGGLGGKWFSTPGTSYGARSIPPGLSPYTQFKVLKPFEVQKSLASPGMFNGQTGFGIQFQSPVGADILIKRGIIAPF